MRIFLVLLCAVLAGCGSYDGLFEYAPSPAQVALVDDASDGSQGQVLAAVRGLRTVDEGDGERLVFDVPLRLENGGDGAWRFDPDAVRLVTGDLVRLELWSAEPGIATDVQPGAVLDVTLAFALPPGTSPGDLDLDGVHLSVRLAQGSDTRIVNVGFERRVPVVVTSYHHHPFWWSDPWYSYPYPYRHWRPRAKRPRRRR